VSFEYRILGKGDLHSLVELQKRALPDDFLTLLGERFLERIYFPILLGDPRNLVLGAKKGAELAGYVAFNPGGTALSDLLRHKPASLLKAVVRKSVSPIFLLRGIGVARLLALRKSPPEEQGTELAFIAVSPEHQGRGIGKELVARAIALLRDRGQTDLWVKTLASTPRNVKFYEGLGFRVYDRRFGRVYLSRKVAAENLMGKS
jgi:ribosomal protein S18 acetylase RimI-like enzyme